MPDTGRHHSIGDSFPLLEARHVDALVDALRGTNVVLMQVVEAAQRLAKRSALSVERERTIIAKLEQLVDNTAALPKILAELQLHRRPP